METKRYYATANPTMAYPSSEYTELAGKTVKLQHIEHRGVRVEDAATRIKKLAAGDQAEAEEKACVRMWLRWEFNIPATIRAHCLTSFIKVFTNEEFVAYLDTDKVFNYSEHSYKLHWQSNMSVCMMAPLIAVSFRVTPEGEYFAVAQVWAARDSKAASLQKVVYDPAKLANIPPTTVNKE